MKTSNNIYQNEARSVAAVALIFAFRMLGLFMILPIFALAADNYTGATESLIGLALGIYGLTQACLQIPFGTLSDRFGRRPIILAGLALFALGSVIAALSTSITGVIIGRAIQGGGAIGSTLLALISDLTRVENRSKAMAMVGMSIGASFMLAMILGPFINAWFQLHGLFWFTGGLALLGMLVLTFLVPHAPLPDAQHQPPLLPMMMSTLKNTQLLRLDFSIFSLHAILTALFVVLPLVIERYVGIRANHQPVLYLSVLIGAFCVMLPIMILSEKRHKTKEVMLLAITTLALSTFGLYCFHTSLILVALIMLAFFAAFSLLEATLPSLISKLAPASSKGTALGIYSTSQFLGIFFGGTAGGILLEQLGIPSVLLFCMALAVFWLAIAATLPSPPALRSILLPIEKFDANQASALHEHLSSQPGVLEVTLIHESKVAHLKIDHRHITEQELVEITQTFTQTSP